MLKRMFKKKKGFTLTELIVVVTILGILTAVAVPLVTSYIADAEASSDNTNATTIEGVAKRAAASRSSGFDIDSSMVAADVTVLVTLIQAELGTMPTLQQGADYEFYIHKATGKVAVGQELADVTSVVDGSGTGDWLPIVP